MQKRIFTAALWGVTGSWQLEEETVEYRAKHGVAKDGGPGCPLGGPGCTHYSVAGTVEERKGSCSQQGPVK